MKKLILLLIVVLGLIGCGMTSITVQEPKEPNRLVGVTVDSKRVDNLPCVSASCSDDYFVTFEKNGQKIELEVYTEKMYDILPIGTVVDVIYSDDFYVEDIKLPAFGE